jgi:hypothetical protein
MVEQWKELLMLAYTAWDSLRTIAREFDADLTLQAEGRVALTPHRAPVESSAAVRRTAERIVAGFGVLLALVAGTA